MALAQLPLTASNKGWGISKSPITSTRVLTAASGVEYRSQNWQYPRWKFSVPVPVLRQFGSYQEYTNLVGFILSQAGQFNNWLYDDPSDDSVTNQNIGVGNGSQQNFPLVRTVGGYTEPVYYANVVSAVYLNGVLQDPSTYNVIQTGSYGPDTISLNTPPAGASVVSATFTFFFVCRFTTDATELLNNYNGRWEVKKLEFESLK